jgi:mutator protein MutT
MPKQPFPAQVLAEELLAWWAERGRLGIPWKMLPEGASPAPEQDLDPYGIWIAEVMLQQTQLAVALPYWERWMMAFPSLEALAAASLEEVRDLNQALMDLGATVCTPRMPSCEACPWRLHCAAYASGDPCRWPVTEAPKPLPFHVIGVGVVLNTAGEVLIDQRLEQGLLGGMWEFPGGKQEEGETIETCIARELNEELGITVTVGAELITVDHAYSHKKLRFVVHLCDWQSGEPQPLASQQVRWVRPDDLKNYAFPAANAKIIAALLGRLTSSAHS